MEGFWQDQLPWQCFKYFSVLNFLIETGTLLNRFYYSCSFICRWPKAGVGRLLNTCHASVRACVCLSHFYMNLYFSFICEDIFIRFAENVKDCGNISVKTLVLILKNNMAAIANCLKNHWYVLKFKMLQQALSDSHKT